MRGLDRVINERRQVAGKERLPDRKPVYKAICSNASVLLLIYRMYGHHI